MRCFVACARLWQVCPKAAMFDLRDRGFSTPFEQLVGSLISARTRDETTMEVCLRLFEQARTPEAMAALGESKLAELLRGASFPEPKARDLIELSRRISEEHDGVVPDTIEGLTAFRGVGPKIAALTLAVGFGRPAIAVDIHVHRIVNRWGYVATSTPEKTMLALETQLPQRYWIEINERLVPFGQVRLHRGQPALLHLPFARLLPAGGRDFASVIVRKSTSERLKIRAKPLLKFRFDLSSGHDPGDSGQGQARGEHGHHSDSPFPGDEPGLRGQDRHQGQQGQADQDHVRLATFVSGPCEHPST